MSGPKSPVGAEGQAALMYRQAILDHYKSPRNWGTTDPVDVRHEGENPLCGDRITVTLALDGERIVDARFEGTGCAISQAAADIFLGEVKGKTAADVTAMDRDTIVALLGITLSPARVKCAVLGLEVTRDGLRIRAGELEAGGPSRTELTSYRKGS